MLITDCQILNPHQGQVLWTIKYQLSGLWFLFFATEMVIQLADNLLISLK